MLVLNPKIKKIKIFFFKKVCSLLIIQYDKNNMLIKDIEKSLKNGPVIKKNGIKENKKFENNKKLTVSLFDIKFI